MKIIKETNYTAYIGNKEELEKINQEKNIGWRGIIGVTKFDDLKKHLYINLSSNQRISGDKELIKLYINITFGLKVTISEDLWSELNKL